MLFIEIVVGTNGKLKFGGPSCLFESIPDLLRREMDLDGMFDTVSVYKRSLKAQPRGWAMTLRRDHLFREPT